ncbi:MAG TPA: acyltransferase [Bryobacteraceae bacterium]|nr:acyltransferase [Bryobacteraceae bacterium]
MTPARYAMNGQELGGLYSYHELAEMLGSVGDDVCVNRSVVFYAAKNIHLGSHVRIDCFCVISAGPAGVEIEDYAHIGAHCTLIGSAGRIHMEPFSALSANACLFTATEDYSGGAMITPTVPSRYRNTRTGDLTLKRHAVVGCGSVLLPGVTLGLASSVGALSLVSGSVPDFTVVFGNPARKVGRRDPRVLDLEREFLSGEANY